MDTHSAEAFSYAVTDGWIRDLASAPTPHDRWPCIRWDEQLLADQLRFLDAQAQMGVGYNVVWGLFVDRAWPVPFEHLLDDARRARLAALVEAAHARGIKLLSGVGVYSWGFEEVIAKVPGVSRGHGMAMCLQSPVAWDWQRRVLDFLMDPALGLDGVSLQSADQGRCECEDCARLTPAEHHAQILGRTAEYIRAQRPEWAIGKAAWNLRLDDPADRAAVVAISNAVDYLVEVEELSARHGTRRDLVQALGCAFGSVGGVFVEPPQHWERQRWFLPCGLRSARALQALWQDGGRACEFFYRPFANPGEEISWRTGARILSRPATPPEAALAEAVGAVYHVTGAERAALADWYRRAEDAYFQRSSYTVGSGPLSLEPLVWEQDPCGPGPAVYLRDRMSNAQRAEYAADLRALRAELAAMHLPDPSPVAQTLTCLDGALRELAALGVP